MSLISISAALIAWALQLSVFVGVAAILPSVLFARAPHKWMPRALFCLLLCLELAGAWHLSRNPFWHCPPEYQGYVSAQERQRIVDFHSGLYSETLPVFPVYIAVQAADNVRITVKTHYFLFGYTETELTEDGPFMVRSLSGGLS